ncbi:MAG: EAL domain-containing protein [Oscillospiraceae bacterium]
MSKLGKKFIIGAVFVVVIFILITTFYSIFVTNLLTKESQMHLSEVAAQGADSVKRQSARDFDILEVLADGIISDPNIPIEQKISRLKKQADKFNLFRMGLVDSSGNAICTDDTEFSVLDRTFFQESIKGNNYVSEPLIDKVNGKAQGIVYSVPVWYNGKVEYVLFAGYEVSALMDKIDINFYNGNGFAYIVNSNGDVILHPSSGRQGKNLFAIADGNNSESVIESFRSDLKNGKTGVVRLHMHEDDRFFAYSPINGLNDWFLVSSLPSEIVFERSQNVIFTTMFFMAVLVIIFVLMIAFILRSRRQANAKIARLAYYDTLTGAPNLERFKLDAQKLVRENGAQNYTILNFDVKQFKYINKDLGFHAGNEFLRYISACLKNTAQKDEVFARISSDHFIFLFLNKMNADETKSYIFKLRKSILSWDKIADGVYTARINFGVYHLDEHDSDPMMAIEKSDIARKSIKTSYVSELAVYNEAMQLLIDRDKAFENSMHSALEDGEFKLFIQPKYDLQTETVVGGEALVRWVRPDGKMLMPGDFIPLFEKNGFLATLDLYMLEKVCLFLRSQLDRGIVPMPISINQSRYYMYTPTYVDSLCEKLRASDISPSLIELEITENIVYSNLNELFSILELLHSHGFSISLDDFGSGYSSLNVLKDLKVDTLKLDKVLLDESLDSSRGKTIVSNIIRMAKELEISVVAEGVETREQVEFLREFGCQTAQGYYYSKPLPADEFDLLLS